MRTRQIGRTDIQASVIGLGTWAIGGDFWGGTDKQEALKTIQCAIDNGVNLIDTAPIYGFGAAEEILGEAIQRCRHQVIISTKCGLNWQTSQGQFVANVSGHSIYRNLNPDFIRQEIENSLRRLKTDYIDIYFTHWQEDLTPLSEIMDLLYSLRKEGKIRAIGASNVSLTQLESYQQLGGIDVGQEEYNLLNRKIELALLPYCLTHEISLFAYCPLAQGLLTNKIQPGHQFAPGDMRKNMKSFSDENIRKVIALNEQLIQIANHYNSTIAQLIIAWTLAQPGITHVLCGARQPHHLIENVKAEALILSSEDLQLIRQLAEESGATFGMYV